MPLSLPARLHISSLLGTWHGGHASEKWDAKTSSLYQVLLSIQGMILVEEPMYNEPGTSGAGTPEGDRKSKLYNDTIRVATLKCAPPCRHVRRAMPAACHLWQGRWAGGQWVAQGWGVNLADSARSGEHGAGAATAAQTVFSNSACTLPVDVFPGTRWSTCSGGRRQGSKMLSEGTFSTLGPQ